MKYEWALSEPNAKESILKLSRKFCIDLSPSVLYSRGSLIELLISSDVSKYCEFRLVSNILTKNENNKLEKVPTSRSDVFKSNRLSMIDKRMMMKFIQACIKDNDYKDLLDQNQKLESLSFKELVNSKKLSESITNYLINAVAMSPDEELSAIDVKYFFLSFFLSSFYNAIYFNIF